VGGVTCEVTYLWPDALALGYFPLGIKLTNGEERSSVVTVESERIWGAKDITRRRLTLEGGATAEFELLMRAGIWGTNLATVTVEVGGDEVSIGPTGPTDSLDPLTRCLMVVTHWKPPAGTEQARSETWSELALGGKPARGARLLATSARTFDQLSTNWQAYTSLDSVILDLSSGRPGPDRLAALGTWCRAGGKLIVVGSGLEELAEIEAFAPPTEPRFERRPEDPEPFEAAGLVAFKYGFGTLIAERESSPGESALDASGPGVLPRALVADQAKFMAAWNRPGFSSISRQSWVQGTLAAFDDLPLRSLMVLLVLFALVMGPANFLWIKKMKRPVLLLVTVPGIALVTSAALLLYGVLSQGLDIKAITKSWSILDQRGGVATTAEVREVFAGSAPGAGLRPRAGTAVLPEERFWRSGFQGRHTFIADQTEGLLLAGDYFPVRQPFSQLILGDRPSRLRLDVVEAGGEIEVSNMLGANIEKLLLRAGNGEYHFLEGGLAEGARTRLVPGGRSAKLALWREDLKWCWGGGSDSTLPTATFIARLDRAPLADDCGVEVTEIEGRHILLGILDPIAVAAK